jgi:signal transduction histidine kinase
VNGWHEVPADTVAYDVKSHWSLESAGAALPGQEFGDPAIPRSSCVASEIGRNIGAMIRQGLPLQGVLHALCQFFEGIFRGYTSMVFLLDRAGVTVEDAVGPGLDTHSEKRFHKCTVFDVELARLPRLRLCQATPIQTLTGETLAIFTVYQQESCVTPCVGLPTTIERFIQIAGATIERFRHEEALKRSAALLRETQLLSSTYCFSWSVDSDEFICSIELGQLYELGSTAYSVTLDQIRSRIHSEDLASFQETIARARSGVSDFEHWHRLRMPDNSIKDLHIVAHRTYDYKKRLEYIGVIRDVTHRRRTQETLAALRVELTEAARLASLGVLSAAIAHEVNQPLSGIVTNADTCRRMLSSDPPNVEGALETARRTIRDAERACEVIKRVRTLFGGKDASCEVLNLNDAVTEVIALSLDQLQRNQVVLRTEFAIDLPEIHGDRVQLQQVILNLLSNASEAMSNVEDRPHILVITTAREDDRFVRVSVQDTGPGIEPDSIKRLFDAFYTTKTDGMGIGLCISQSIIERHQGRLWAVPNDGPGVTFSFVIPIDCESEVNCAVPPVRFASRASGPNSRSA